MNKSKVFLSLWLSERRPRPDLEALRFFGSTIHLKSLEHFLGCPSRPTILFGAAHSEYTSCNPPTLSTTGHGQEPKPLLEENKMQFMAQHVGVSNCLRCCYLLSKHMSMGHLYKGVKPLLHQAMEGMDQCRYQIVASSFSINPGCQHHLMNNHSSLLLFCQISCSCEFQAFHLVLLVQMLCS